MPQKTRSRGVNVAMNVTSPPRPWTHNPRRFEGPVPPPAGTRLVISYSAWAGRPLRPTPRE
eukprot:1951812-Prymnesium_polylepis.1